MAKRICADCNRIYESAHSLQCPNCRANKAELNKQHYGTVSYKVARTRQLQQHPNCHYCEYLGIETPATEADHIYPVSEYGHNLEFVSSCKPHNSARGNTSYKEFLLSLRG